MQGLDSAKSVNWFSAHTKSIFAYVWVHSYKSGSLFPAKADLLQKTKPEVEFEVAQCHNVCNLLTPGEFAEIGVLRIHFNLGVLNW